MPHIDNYETPLEAFRNKKTTDAIRKSDPKWNGEDQDADEILEILSDE